MAKILDEYKPIVTQGKKIVSALGIDLSTHNHAEHLQKLADKTLEGSLNDIILELLFNAVAPCSIKLYSSFTPSKEPTRCEWFFKFSLK